MKQRVSLVQPNFQHGPSWLNIFFLPYSVGCVWAYAIAQADIAEQFELDQIVWDRNPIDELAQQLAQNDIVLFSTYVWNRNYNYRLARAIKKINPKVLAVFGGPEPAITDPNIFREHEFIDVIVKREGELVFLDMLRNIENLKSVPGVILNDAGTPFDTGESGRIDDLSVIPSPYLTGLFDDIMTENPHVNWNMTLETNRGCPYQCTFCDWGSLTYSKVRQFPLQRVLDEIDWAAQYANGIYCADANFGMFVDRDRTIVEKVISSHQENRSLCYVYFNWAKNQKNEVVSMVKMLSQQPELLSNGLTVSTQSMTPKVLDIIKRTNLQQHKIEEIYKITKANNVMAYTELILGLPGESQESFKDSVFELLEMGVHNGVEINQAQLFSNAEMNTVQREVYDIKTLEMWDYVSMYQTRESDPIETVSVVTGTSTMPFADMVDTNTWVSFMQAFHFYGFATQISRFLRSNNHESYRDFYNKLYAYAKQDREMARVITTVRGQVQDWFEHGYVPRPSIKDITFNGLNLLAGISLHIHSEQLISHVFQLLDRFLTDTYELPEQLQKQLMSYQREITLGYNKIQNNYKSTVKYDYDFHNYIEEGGELNAPCRITFALRPIQQDLHYTQFLESVFFKRRQRIGVLGVERESVCIE